MKQPYEKEGEMWNWLMVRPERMIVTVGAVAVALAAGSVAYNESRSLFPAMTEERLEAFHSDGWEFYTAEFHETAWQANCQRLQRPGRRCGD